MYWTDSLAPGLFRADLDGTRIEPIAVAGGASDGDIALDFATGFVFRSSPSQGRVYRHGYDGTNAKTLVERHAIYPRNLAVHPAADLMFWTSAGWNVGFGIRRARLDGNLIETIIPIDSIREPLGVALDLRADKIYWLEAIGSNEVKIRRADLRGANVEDVLAAGVPGAGNGSVAGALALNPDGCEIYWAAGVGGIHRSLLDGSDVELLSRDQTGVVRGLVIDEQGRKMYWAATEWPDNAALGSVRRANLDGSDIEQLLSGPFESLSVAIDSAVEMMYWAEECSFLSSIIRRTSLDGLHTEDVVPLGSYYPWTIALDPRTFADFDADRDVDLNDLARLQNCFTGDGPTDVRAECVFFDADPADHDVDAADYAAFGIQFRRP